MPGHAARSTGMRMLLAGLLTLALPLGGLAVAAAPGSPDTPDAAIVSGKAARDLAAARARWHARGFPSYRFHVTQTCFCGPREGSAAITVRGGRPGTVPDRLRAAATVPRLFALVAAAIRDRVAGLQVTYDTRRGYVRHVYIDRSAMIADEEVGYDVRGLTRVLPAR